MVVRPAARAIQVAILILIDHNDRSRLVRTSKRQSEATDVYVQEHDLHAFLVYRLRRRRAAAILTIPFHKLAKKTVVACG
jgi:hypothetical protein